MRASELRTLRERSEPELLTERGSSEGDDPLARVWAGVRPRKNGGGCRAASPAGSRAEPGRRRPRGQPPAGKVECRTADWRPGGCPLAELSWPAACAYLGLGVAVGGVDEGLAALVAVGPATARGIPIDAALGVPGRVLAAVFGLAHQAAGGLLALFLLLGLGSGLGGGFLGGAFGVDRGLLGVEGLLLEGKKSLVHGEGLARVGPGQRCGVSPRLGASE